MKATDIVESWMWRDPEEIIERLLVASARRPQGRLKPVVVPISRDRYYTRARRLHIAGLMKGKR